MIRELFIQSYKIIPLFSNKESMIIDSDDRILKVLATESTRLQRERVLEGLYPTYEPVLTRMIMVEPENEVFWLVDESCGINKVYKDKISIPGGHVEFDYDLANSSPLGLFVNNISRELVEEFVGDKYEIPINCDIYHISDLPEVLKYVGFTCDDPNIEVKLYYTPCWGVSVLFFARCHPTLAYKRNAIPFANSEFSVVKDLYRFKEDVRGRERAANYLESVAMIDVRLKTGNHRAFMNSIFDYIKSNY